LNCVEYSVKQKIKQLGGNEMEGNSP